MLLAVEVVIRNDNNQKELILKQIYGGDGVRGQTVDEVEILQLWLVVDNSVEVCLKMTIL